MMMVFRSQLLLCIFIYGTDGTAVYKTVNMTTGTAKINHIGVNVAHDKMLNTTYHASYNTSNANECIIKCLYQPNGCSSLNYFKENTQPKENCFLLKDNWFEKKAWFQTAYYALHIYVKNTGCDRQLCLNGGTCIPNYQDDTFQCVCAGSFHGTFCGSPIEIPIPNYQFSFENNLENTGLQPGGMVLSMVNGQLLQRPERPGKVLYCSNKKCVNNDQTYDKWLAPGDITKLTITLWVKLRNFKISEFSDISWFACPINSFHTGFRICYHHDIKRWFVCAIGSLNQHCQYHELSYDKAQRWQHLALVWDKPTLKAFINGQNGTIHELDQRVISETPDITRWHIFNSDFSNSNTVKNNPMYIDDFTVWYKALSDNDIKKIYEDSRYI